MGLSLLVASVLGLVRSYVRVKYVFENPGYGVFDYYALSALLRWLGYSRKEDIGVVKVYAPITLRDEGFDPLGGASELISVLRSRGADVSILEELAEEGKLEVVPVIGGGTTGKHVYRYGPEAVFNIIVLDLLREYYGGRRFSRIVVDLTHGTNIHVSTLIFAVLVVKELLGLSVEAYAAPILGRVGEDVEVRYQDVTRIIDFYDYVLALSSLFRLDERPLEDLVEEYERRRGERKTIFAEDIVDSRLRDRVGKAFRVRNSLLAMVKALRLALPIIAYKKSVDASKLSTEELLELVHGFYDKLLREVASSVRDNVGTVDLHSSSLSLLLPSLALTTLVARDRLMEIFSPSNGISAFLSAMKLYVDEKMVLQLLITATESSHLFTLLELGLAGKVRVGGNEWSIAEFIANMYRYVKAYKDAKLLEPIGKLVAPQLASKVKEYRNQVAHAGLPRDKTVLDLDKCEVTYTSSVRLDPTTIENNALRSLKEVLERLEKIKHKCIS